MADPVHPDLEVGNNVGISSRKKTRNATAAPNNTAFTAKTRHSNDLDPDVTARLHWPGALSPLTTPPLTPLTMLASRRSHREACHPRRPPQRARAARSRARREHPPFSPPQRATAAASCARA